jgi:peptidoglycan/xylan/chitin deacetylase (PgdA/CDA1 family)
VVVHDALSTVALVQRSPLSGRSRGCAAAAAARRCQPTFDDGCDNFTALPLLKRYAMPATVFVACGYLNGGRMWNDTIIEAIRTCRKAELDLRDDGLPRLAVGTAEEKRQAIDTLLSGLKYRPVGERDRLSGRIARRAQAQLPDDLMLTSGQVRELRSAGVEIGAHTVRHPILAHTTEPDAEREIRDSKRELERLLEAEVPHFAYPNGQPGKDYGAVHVEMVRRAGFRGAFSDGQGVATARSDLFSRRASRTVGGRRCSRCGLRAAWRAAACDTVRWRVRLDDSCRSDSRGTRRAERSRACAAHASFRRRIARLASVLIPVILAASLPRGRAMRAGGNSRDARDLHRDRARASPATGCCSSRATTGGPADPVRTGRASADRIGAQDPAPPAISRATRAQHREHRGPAHVEIRELRPGRPRHRRRCGQQAEGIRYAHHITLRNLHITGTVSTSRSSQSHEVPA